MANKCFLNKGFDYSVMEFVGSFPFAVGRQTVVIPFILKGLPIETFVLNGVCVTFAFYLHRFSGGIVPIPFGFGGGENYIIGDSVFDIPDGRPKNFLFDLLPTSLVLRDTMMTFSHAVPFFPSIVLVPPSYINVHLEIGYFLSYPVLGDIIRFRASFCLETLFL